MDCGITEYNIAFDNCRLWPQLLDSVPSYQDPSLLLTSLLFSLAWDGQEALSWQVHYPRVSFRESGYWSPHCCLHSMPLGQNPQIMHVAKLQSVFYVPGRKIYSLFWESIPRSKTPENSAPVGSEQTPHSLYFQSFSLSSLPSCEIFVTWKHINVLESVSFLQKLVCFKVKYHTLFSLVITKLHVSKESHFFWVWIWWGEGQGREPMNEST